MITEVHLKNFQAHRDLKLKFTPGVNIIRGSSDAGKSAIIRAMMALITGKEFSASYQTWGTTGPMEVTIKTEEHEVTRGRSARKNFFRVDGKEYSAVGTATPREVSACLPIQSDRDSDNLGSQYSSFYLLSDTAGNVAKKIQAVCDLVSISRVSKELSIQVRHASDDERVLVRELDDVGKALSGLDDVDIFRKRFSRLRERYVYLEEQKSQKALYERTLEGFRSLESYENFAAGAALRQDYEKCKEGFRELENRRSDARVLRKVLASVVRSERNIRDGQILASKLPAIKEDYAGLHRAVSDLEKRKLEVIKLHGLLMDWRKVDNNLQKEVKKLSTLREEEATLKETLQICPLCGHRYE